MKNPTLSILGMLFLFGLITLLPFDAEVQTAITSGLLAGPFAMVDSSGGEVVIFRLD